MANVAQRLAGTPAARLTRLFDPGCDPLASFRVFLEAVAYEWVLGPLSMLSVAMSKSAQGPLGEIEIVIIYFNGRSMCASLANMGG